MVKRDYSELSELQKQKYVRWLKNRGWRVSEDLRPIDEILTEKLDSTEKYLVKEVSGMVAVQAILAPKRYVKTTQELEDIVMEFMMGYKKGIILQRLGPTMRFVETVAEYMIRKAGNLHIKEYIFPEKENKKNETLDDLFI